MKRFGFYLVALTLLASCSMQQQRGSSAMRVPASLPEKSCADLLQNIAKESILNFRYHHIKEEYFKFAMTLHNMFLEAKSLGQTMSSEVKARSLDVLKDRLTDVYEAEMRLHNLYPEQYPLPAMLKNRDIGENMGIALSQIDGGTLVHYILYEELGEFKVTLENGIFTHNGKRINVKDENESLLIVQDMFGYYYMAKPDYAWIKDGVIKLSSITAGIPVAFAGFVTKAENGVLKEIKINLSPIKPQQRNSYDIRVEHIRQFKKSLNKANTDTSDLIIDLSI